MNNLVMKSRLTWFVLAIWPRRRPWKKNRRSWTIRWVSGVCATTVCWKSRTWSNPRKRRRKTNCRRFTSCCRSFRWRITSRCRCRVRGASAKKPPASCGERSAVHRRLKSATVGRERALRATRWLTIRIRALKISGWLISKVSYWQSNRPRTWSKHEIQAVKLTCFDSWTIQPTQPKFFCWRSSGSVAAGSRH